MTSSDAVISLQLICSSHLNLFFSRGQMFLLFLPRCIYHAHHKLCLAPSVGLYFSLRGTDGKRGLDSLVRVLYLECHGIFPRIKSRDVYFVEAEKFFENKIRVERMK